MWQLTVYIEEKELPVQLESDPYRALVKGRFAEMLGQTLENRLSEAQVAQAVQGRCTVLDSEGDRIFPPPDSLLPEQADWDSLVAVEQSLDKIVGNVEQAERLLAEAEQELASLGEPEQVRARLDGQLTQEQARLEALSSHLGHLKRKVEAVEEKEEPPNQ